MRPGAASILVATTGASYPGCSQNAFAGPVAAADAAQVGVESRNRRARALEVWSGQLGRA